ncbi:molybdopterin-dependent oxidoreductase [Pluralibacter sp.]|uniref:molybdopterin-dependent oxidoreductase n=1 Tax=Pluralibacter sp. TaxID=1920032 RepID=UPI002601454D|nr:molybdopterin-dependent oxidoreductase [Pluralibacter sp.]MBV8042800.1 oxidoreductase [Pluralibacter sp.]
MRVFLYLVISSLFLSTCYAASTTSAPEDKVVLTISGKIGSNGQGEPQKFSIADLEKMGSETIETTTPWYDGRMRFEGVSFNKLFDKVNAQGQTVKVIALNDYTISVPVDDLKKFNAILAYKRNGNFMPIRDKGPLFIIYPYDSKPELNNQVYYARSAWQVDRIIVQ